MTARHQQEAFRAAEELDGADLQILQSNHQNRRACPFLRSVEPKPCHMLSAELFKFLF